MHMKQPELYDIESQPTHPEEMSSSPLRLSICRTTNCEMEDGLIYPPDVERAVLHPYRDKGYKTLIHDMLLSVYPQLDFTAQIMNVIQIGPE